MKLIKKIQQSFSAKISISVLLITTAIFVACFFFFYFFTSQTIREASGDKAKNMLNITKLRIENVLTGIKTAHANLIPTIRRKMAEPDSLYKLTGDILRNNAFISGCAIAFEPSYFELKGHYFSPYSSRDSSGNIHTIQLGKDDYDYFSMEWYAEPKRKDEPHWTSPYYDEGGGEMLMFTYSTPMVDENGNFFGVFTSDISLDWLTDVVNDQKPYPSSYCIMLDHDATYIIHPSKELILKQTMFSLADSLNEKQMEIIALDMINGGVSDAALNRTPHEPGVKSHIFYRPLDSNTWSLGMIIHNDDIYKELNNTRNKIILLLIAGLILLFIFCRIIVKRLTNPLNVFAKSAMEIAHGNFNVQLPEIKSDDEMGEMRNSFVFMQKELQNYISELELTTSKKERIESELRIASNIQMGMIPKIFPPFPERDDIDVYAMLKPAKEVGGDLYDFFIEDDKFYFTIGDVSGKGVPASLFMAVTRSLFRSVAALYEDPAQIVTSMNNSITETNDSYMFVTLFVGILHLPTGRLRYCNAGHNPPIITTPEGDVYFMKVAPNVPVGTMEEYQFTSGETILEKDSSLFLYTDGLTESENDTYQQYTEERIIRELAALRGAEPKVVIHTIADTVLNHADGTEQNDDLTLFTIHYKK